MKSFEQVLKQAKAEGPVLDVVQYGDDLYSCEVKYLDGELREKVVEALKKDGKL